MNLINLTLILAALGASVGEASDEEWVALCKKVEQADLVFEAVFDVRRDATSAGRDLAVSLVETAQITRIVKGNLEGGAFWQDSFGNPFAGYGPVHLTESLLGKNQVRMIVFLKKKEDGYINISGREGIWGCERSSHVSWCLSYVDYWRQALECVDCLGKMPGKYPRCY